MLKSRKGQEGFTLIELLVVVLIIGILAAIAIPAFLGQKKGAQDSNAKSLLRNSAIALESYYSDHQDFFTPGGAAAGTILTAADMKGIEPNIKWTTTSTAPAVADAGVQAKGDNVTVVVPTTGDSYTLYAASQSGNGFTYVRGTDASVVKCKASAAFATTCSPNQW